MNTEVWKPIPNYEGEYSLSTLGRVRSAWLMPAGLFLLERASASLAGCRLTAWSSLPTIPWRSCSRWPVRGGAGLTVTP